MEYCNVCHTIVNMYTIVELHIFKRQKKVQFPIHLCYFPLFTCVSRRLMIVLFRRQEVKRHISPNYLLTFFYRKQHPYVEATHRLGKLLTDRVV